MSNQDFITNGWYSAQSGCIGCVCIDPELAGRLLAETSADDFSESGRLVYQAISALFHDGQRVDPITINEKLSGECHDYLYQCIETTPSVHGFGDYVAIVKEKGRMSRVQDALLKAAYSPTMEAMNNWLSTANDLMVDRKKSSVFTMEDLIKDFYTRKKTVETYIQTGLRPLDATLYLSAGDYVVLAGRPSRGKTALALQMAMDQSWRYRVGFYSLETSQGKIMDRIMSHYSKVSMDKIKKANMEASDWKKVDECVKPMEDRVHLEIIPAAGWTVDDIFHQAIARRHEIIYIDYLQIISGEGKSRYDQVTAISVRIHQLAQRHGIMVVALSQLNREVTGKTSEEPDMSDLRESGQIEQDADAILMIYCQTKDRTDGPRWLKIAKNKEGETALLALAWDGDTQTLTPMTRRTPPHIPKTIRPLPDNTPVPPQFEQMTMEGTNA